MKHKHLILLLLILFTSCKVDNELNTIFKDIKIVKCRQIELNEILGKPNQLNVVDNYLIFMDEIENKLLTFYDITKKQIVWRCFYEGQGPNDLLMPVRVDVDTKNKIISIFQRRNGIYRAYNLTELLDNNTISIIEINFPFGTEYVKKYDNGYFASGFFENGPVAIHDKMGNLQNTINVYPDYLNVIKDVSNKYRIGQGPIDCLNDSIFVFASIFTGDIKFYNIHDNYSLIPIESYFLKTASSNFKNRVNNSPHNTPILETDIEHFTHIYTTNKYIYVLYSGESMKNKNNAKNSYVLKFDKKGKPIECYKTDYKLFQICVDENDTVLYGISISENLDYILIEASIS